MQMKMTARDKKLLVMLCVIVIVFLIGYCGIYPIIKKINKTQTNIEKQQDIHDMNELKIANLPMAQADNEKMEKDIEAGKNQFFKIMKSGDVDKYLTNEALSYKLYCYDLSIDMEKTPAKLDPYMYSKAALSPTEETTDDDSTDDSDSSGGSSIAAAADAAEKAGSSDSENEGEDDTTDSVGIYRANVSMRLGGTESDLNQFMEHMAKSDSILRITSYSWDNVRDLNYSDDGTYEVQYEKILTVDMELYMCED